MGGERSHGKSSQQEDGRELIAYGDTKLAARLPSPGKAEEEEGVHLIFSQNTQSMRVLGVGGVRWGVRAPVSPGAWAQSKHCLGHWRVRVTRSTHHPGWSTTGRRRGPGSESPYPHMVICSHWKESREQKAFCRGWSVDRTRGVGTMCGPRPTSPPLPTYLLHI